MGLDVCLLDNLSYYTSFFSMAFLELHNENLRKLGTEAKAKHLRLLRLVWRTRS